MKKLMLGTAVVLFAANFAHAAVILQEQEGPDPAVLALRPEKTAAKEGIFQDEQSSSDEGMRTKTYSKAYTVDANDKLNLSNRFGEVVFKTWDKNEIKVDVDIKAYGRNGTEAQRLLDETSIESGKSGDGVFFKTVINSNDNNYGRGTKNGKITWRRVVKINYVVYLPASSALTVNNQYGNVSMGNFSGALYAKVQYGDFTAGKLSSNNNYVSVQYGKANIQEANKLIVKHQYGSGLTIGTVSNLNLDAQYISVTISTIKGDAVIKQQYGSGLTIGSVDNLDLDVQYSNVNVANISGNAVIKQQYNNISIGSVNKLSLDAEYATVKISTLKGDGNLKASYNKLTIDQIGNGCKNLTVKISYAGVSLGFNSGYRADFDVKTSYGSFKHGADVSSKVIDDGDTSKSYSGKIGEGGSGRVSVKSEYGNVSFN